MKRRKGFRQVVVDGTPYQYAVSKDRLIVYDTTGQKFEIPLQPLSALGLAGSVTWRGKHGDRSYGKREVAALIRTISCSLSTE